MLGLRIPDRHERLILNMKIISESNIQSCYIVYWFFELQFKIRLFGGQNSARQSSLTTNKILLYLSWFALQPPSLLIRFKWFIVLFLKVIYIKIKANLNEITEYLNKFVAWSAKWHSSNVISIVIMSFCLIELLN